MQVCQASLFGWDEPSIALGRGRRDELSPSAWVDYHQGCVDGHERLFATLRERIRWQGASRVMYERVVDVPRLLGELDDGAEMPAVLRDLQVALERRYGAKLPSVGFALYRGGADSVAWHRDRGLRDMRSSVSAILSLGAPRKFMLRPLGGGPSRTIQVGWGDVVVLGGECQRTWEHCVPKARHAEPRIAVMYRPHRPPPPS